jgi:hypothetical protein
MNTGLGRFVAQDDRKNDAAVFDAFDGGHGGAAK